MMSVGSSVGRRRRPGSDGDRRTAPVDVAVPPPLTAAPAAIDENETGLYDASTSLIDRE